MPVYVNNCLTPERRKLLNAARQVKKRTNSIPIWAHLPPSGVEGKGQRVSPLGHSGQGSVECSRVVVEVRSAR
ncbi:hypothetical protein J6590_092671 [Homalodisca vitripennis]|nr:hypothetical protein J6590_092671 [Homalodisca vitripennis]